MSEFRFKVGTLVMCNLGPDGWKLGRVIALHYREMDWPTNMVAPYQVVLEADQMLIYVPEDDARYCREATREDLRISRRMDALAACPDLSDRGVPKIAANFGDTSLGDELTCSGSADHPGDSYRHGRCHCCHRCPRNWSYVELYSEHYRCAERNQLTVTQYSMDLGTLHVGTAIHHAVTEDALPKKGYGQCPTLVRLPPGVSFSDEGVLSGTVAFDPHREERYSVEFVAVSTADWDTGTSGLVRLEIRFLIEGNVPPQGFDSQGFRSQQDQARAEANGIYENLCTAWKRWERRELSHRETCHQMCAELRRLRDILYIHPRLGWWPMVGTAGRLYMNVPASRKCTLRMRALPWVCTDIWECRGATSRRTKWKGCYQKRLLEAARFLWIDGLKQMLDGQWQAAIETFQRAAEKKDGWGWAVNYGDIWLSEAVARIVCSVDEWVREPRDSNKMSHGIAEAQRLVEKASSRAAESRVFGAEGHPWVSDVLNALSAYHDCMNRGADMADWLEDFKLRTAYWCTQVLSGAAPFPPKPKPRLEDAQLLVRGLLELTGQETQGNPAP